MRAVGVVSYARESKLQLDPEVVCSEPERPVALSHYRTTSAPSSTPTTLVNTAASGKLNRVGGAAPLAGVVEAELEADGGEVALALAPVPLELLLNAADVDDGDAVNNANESEVDLDAAAQNCSTSASAEGTSAGQAVRQVRRAVM